MSTQRIVPLLALIVFALSSRASSQDVVVPSLSVRPAHEWTNVFAGKSVQLDCRVTSRNAGAVKVLWSVSVNRATIGRGERTINVEVDKPGDVSLTVDLPELRPGVVSPAALELTLVGPDEKQFQQTVELQVYSPEVTANRQQWLKSLDLAVFDPGKKTRATLDGMKIPYKAVDGPKPQLAGQVLIYGESLDITRLNASWQGALETAASGKRVIVLASKPGAIPLDGLLAAGEVGQTMVVPSSVSLRRNDLIREFDKRLDSTQWPVPGRLNAVSLNVTAKTQGSRVEFREDSTGWNWLDVRYPGGGRLIWTGVGLIESWEATPAARYLFMRLLEEMTDEKPEGGSKHAS